MTHEDEYAILSGAVFSAEEQRTIELKALEQAMRAAGMAHAEPEPLLPVLNTWPFRLTRDDIDFLRNCPYPISPA